MEIKKKDDAGNRSERPGYYAVVPADVRYDPSLPPNAKLLYGEITALCNKEGYCWASNGYFAKLYDKTIVTISQWVSKLVKAGHIKIVVDKERGNKRCIYLLKKTLIGSKENFKTPIKNNFKHNTKAKNNTNLSISQRAQKRDLALETQRAGLEFVDAVEKICKEGGKAPFMPSERVTWYHYRNHLAGLGPDWLNKATAKLRELTTWQDSDDKRTVTDIKKAFGAWMGRVAGYKKREIA